MKQIVAFLLLAVALAPPGAQASIEITQSVVGSGGGGGSGTNHAVLGTVGQPAIGLVTGRSHIHGIGFWYGPEWTITGAEEAEASGPLEYWFGQNHPNPFNPTTTLEFSVPRQSRVTITLYSVEGREVQTVVDEDLAPGRYLRLLDAEGLSSGIYFCRMTASGFTETRKVVLLK
jgi:hypothetical protein